MKKWGMILLLGLFSSCLFPENRSPCVQIAYDEVQDQRSANPIGRIHALFLQNLLGHFPRWQQIIFPIQKYQSGQIEKCEVFIYLGTHFNTDISPAFIADFIATKKRVLWAGYHIWKFTPQELMNLWDVSYQGLATLDWDGKDAAGKPGFFKFFDYKGERFEKYGEFDRKHPDKFKASFEIVLFHRESSTSGGSQVLAWAEHSSTGKRSPYVIANQNHYYIADSPFSFMQEKDRYLIFTDLLFDLLQEAPSRNQDRLAFVRFEDIHPDLPIWQLNAYKKSFEKCGVPFAVSVIPIFADPLLVRVDDPADSMVTLLQRPLFLDFLNDSKKAGGSFIFHGVTHQYGRQKNPFTGVSGDDFEFWDGVNNRPIPDDSISYVVNRLTDGQTLFEKAGIQLSAWLTPHYQASPLDFILFGQLFTWGIGRVTYFPFKAYQAQRLPLELTFNRAGAQGAEERWHYLNDLRVTYPEYLNPSGQMFPYEIWGDVYGQRLVPENLGNIQPFLNEQVHMTQNLDQMLASAKRNRVLRDHWASLFIHPVLVLPNQEEGLGSFPGDGTAVSRLIQGIQNLGYRFIDLEEWVQQQQNLLRPPPIEEMN